MIPINYSRNEEDIHTDEKYRSEGILSCACQASRHDRGPINGRSLGSLLLSTAFAQVQVYGDRDVEVHVAHAELELNLHISNV
jgi:hypothetical protein